MLLQRNNVIPRSQLVLSGGYGLIASDSRRRQVRQTTALEMTDTRLALCKLLPDKEN